MKPQGREGRLKGRIRMLVCKKNDAIEHIKSHLMSSNFTLRGRKSSSYASESAKGSLRISISLISSRCFFCAREMSNRNLVMSGCWSPILRSCSGRRSALRFSSSRAFDKDRQLFSSVERHSDASGNLPPSAAILSAIHRACLLFSVANWRSFL